MGIPRVQESLVMAGAPRDFILNVSKMFIYFFDRSLNYLKIIFIEFLYSYKCTVYILLPKETRK